MPMDSKLAFFTLPSWLFPRSLFSIFPNSLVSTLADPAIASVGPQRLYGPSDMGPQAILTFFKNHVCEVYCNPQWLKLEVVERELLPIQRGLLPPYET